jgi:hypothetical protein
MRTRWRRTVAIAQALPAAGGARMVFIAASDDPALDHGVEDVAGQDVLRDQLIRWFAQLLEVR